MTYKPDYIQRPPVVARGPVQAQQGEQTQATAPGGPPPTAAATTRPGSTVPPTSGQAQHAVPPPTTCAAYMHAPQAEYQQSPQYPPPPPSQTYGVSFTGTAKFAPLPFPPCEHRLPPPSTSTGTRVPPLATIQHGVLLPQQQQHPPPPSYTESCTSSSGNVVGGALAHTPSPSSVASTLLFPPTPAPPPPPPQTSSSSSSLLQHHLVLPFVPQVAASPSPPAPSCSAGATPNLVIVSVPPPLPPVPMFLSTSSGMVPYGHHAPILTPWPPVPLRHIDSYLAGNWPPPPPPQQVVHVQSQMASYHSATGTAQQPPQFKTDLVTFPVQFGGGGGGGGAGSSQAISAQTVLATTSVLEGMRAAYGTPLAASSHEKYPETTAPVPVPAPAPAPAIATAPAPAPTPTPDAQCQVQWCQAHSFCQLSPCHCRICRDHLGWVIRGVRIVDAQTDVEIEPDKVGEAETKETKRLYRCIACGWQSTMESAAGHGGGGGGTSPSKKTAQQQQEQHRKRLSDESGMKTTTTTTTAAAAEAKANANAFSIHYFSHGPVSHPQPQSQPPTQPPFAQGGYPANPIVWSRAERGGGDGGVGGRAGGGGGRGAISPDELVTQTAASASSSGLLMDFSTALNPTGDAASLVAVPYGPQLLPSTDQPYGLETGHQYMHEMFAARQEGLNSPLVASSYPISTQTTQRTQTTQVETTAKQPTTVDYDEEKAVVPPRPAEHEKAEPLAIETASLPPRCRSAVGSPTSAGSPETDTTASPVQNRPASSPSTLETAVTVSPSQSLAVPPAAPLPSSPAPSPCRTPSPASTSPFYTQAYGGYGTLPSPPVMRDDPYPFGYDAPYIGGSRSSSYPPFLSPQHYGPAAEGFLPTSGGPSQIPPGGLMREADPQQQQQQQGMATPGLGLLGMPAPPLSSYFTPPRMSHRKRQSHTGTASAASGKAGKASMSMTMSEKRHFPVAESGFANLGQHSPVRTFQLPPEVDGSLLEPREWPIVKIENIPFNTTVAHLESWLPRGVLAPASQVVLPIHLILHRASGRTLPHCYIECFSQERATEMIVSRDRTRLGDRTVRVKWERAGELLRDLFDQSVYFAHPSPSPAAAPLPHLPPEGFRLPDKLLTRTDLDQLTDYCTKVVGFRERPFERAYFNLASIIAKFPWQRQDLWDAELREAFFKCAYECIRHALMQSRRLGGEAIGYRRMATVINSSMQRCSVFSRSEKEQCRVLFGCGLFSHPAPSAMPQPPATEGDFPPLQTSQPAKPTPPPDQHTPLAGGLYTPPRGGRDGKMRLPDSPETPTPVHVRAGPIRAAITTASAASNFSAAPRASPAPFVRPGNKASFFIGGGWQGGVTSRPLSQPSQDTVSAAAIHPRKQLQSGLSTRSAESLTGKRSFPQQRAPIRDAAKAVSAASTPPMTATTALTKTGQAFGWLATPPESPTEERPRGAKTLTERERLKAKQQDTTSKGWAQE